MFKTLTGLVVSGFLCILATSAFSEVGINVNWGAYTQPILNNKGWALDNSCLVQLILDADRDGIDEPGENGEPSGGDVLLDVSHVRSGSFFPGRFSHNVTISGATVGEHIFVRAWDSGRVKDAAHYGDTRGLQPATWLIDNAVGLTLDATEWGSFRTNIMWTPNAVPAGKLARIYAAELNQNLPNPFKSTTSIGFCVPGRRAYEMIEGGERLADYEGTDVNRIGVSIYDVSGRLVRELVSSNRLPGYCRTAWDATDDSGRKVPSGSYFYRLSVTGSDGSMNVVTRKMVLLK